MARNPVIVRAWPEDRLKLRQMKQVKENGKIESDQEALNRLLRQLQGQANDSAFRMDTHKLFRGLKK